MLIFLASILSGTSILLLKIADTIVQMGDFGTYWFQLIIVGALIAFTGDSQLQHLNRAIKLYDQLMIIPTYQTFIMFSWIGIGLFVFEEYKMYSVLNLCGIFGSVCLSLIGVKFLTMKHRGEKMETRNP